MLPALFTESVTPPSRSLPLWQRAAWVLGGVTCMSLLITAISLEPDAKGHGTHQQLGLPPCSFQVIFGMRCPACGMTTAWANMVRGRVGAALQANLGGTMLALLAMSWGPWWLVSGICGFWIGRPLSERVAVATCLAVVSVTLVDWACRVLIVGR